MSKLVNNEVCNSSAYAWLTERRRSQRPFDDWFAVLCNAFSKKLMDKNVRIHAFTHQNLQNAPQKTHIH